MFTIEIRLRLALVIASLVLGIVLQVTMGFGYSFIFFFAFIFLVVGYFLFGTISGASKKLNEGDIVGAEKYLSYTWKPEWMLEMNQAYFSMLKGMIALQKKDSVNGEKYLLEAYEKGLPTDNEKASALLNLAYISFNKRNFPKTKSYIKTLKELNVAEPMLLVKIKELEDGLKMSGRGNMMGRNQQTMMRGGKRKGGKRR